MKFLLLVVCLIHSHGSNSITVEAKRSDYQNMVDPLMRRSPLDKNFMRFGRSSTPSEEEADDKEPTDARLGKRNFISSDSDDRELDDFLRVERARQNNMMRFGRGRDFQNFIRFGRGRENFMRFGRGRDDNFMRFGRGRNENFMRFGRGKDNFIRFGKSAENIPEDDELEIGREIRSDASKSSNFMRFGREMDVLDRIGRAQTNFLRFGRGKQDGFMRFGRSGGDRNFMRFGRDSDQMTRSTRPAKDKSDGFLRFGRSEGKVPREKRSLVKSDEPFYELFKDFTEEFDPDVNDIDAELEGSSSHQEVWNRKKRSLDETTTTLPSEYEMVDSTSIHLEPPLQYYPTLSAGFPNFIVGPEFSLLPTLDTSNIKPKRGDIGDRNFIRLG
uniref:Uncharacterized protein n=1 Tax=Clastoptera arizonana TaxID=38151 RepID=A0A1B6C1T0_9HEMI